jgi:allantoin racemase
VKILVMNCNTSVTTTQVIGESAKAAARAGTEIVAAQPDWGPSSAEGYLESFMTAAAVLEKLARIHQDFDAVVMAGFGEHGREGARQLLDVPVVDITEAAALLASLVAHRYGVVTTLEPTVEVIRDSLRTSGSLGRCAGIAATDVPVTGIQQHEGDSLSALVAASKSLLVSGADAIVLGCAGFAGLDRELEAALGVPVIDSVAAGVALAEALVQLGKTTSKSGPFRPPKQRDNWRTEPVP